MVERDITTITVSHEMKNDLKRLVELEQPKQVYKVTQAGLLHSLVLAEIERIQKEDK